MVALIVGDSYVKILSKEYDNVYEKNNTNILIRAVVLNIKETDYNYIYEIKVKGKNELNNKAFRLKVKKTNDLKLNYGDLILANGKYQEPKKATNFKGFDYSKYLKSKAIYGTIEASPRNIKIIKHNYENFFKMTINKIQNTIIANTNKMIDNPKIASLLLGMMLGKTENIDDEIIENFKNTSLSHVLAVSGQHMSYILLFIRIFIKSM